MSGLLCRNSNDGRQKHYSDLSGLVCDAKTDEGASRTRQSDLESTDINKIVARFETAGLPLPTGERRFLDLTEVPDFRGAVEQVQRANDYFRSLPAKSRALFENDPAVFLDTVSDPNALRLLVEAGVIPKDEVKAVVTADEIAATARAELMGKQRLAREIERALDREDPELQKGK